MKDCWKEDFSSLKVNKWKQYLVWEEGKLSVQVEGADVQGLSTSFIQGLHASASFLFQGYM